MSAGVREFARAVDDPEGVFGVAQWFPGSGHEVTLGPGEEEFMRTLRGGRGNVPDYPAVQAAAGAVIAAHCARIAGSTRREDLWAAAASLDTSTLFGGFRIESRHRRPGEARDGAGPLDGGRARSSPARPREYAARHLTIST